MDKPGIKTSEFGVTAIVGAISLFNDKLADLTPEQLWAVVIVSVAYILSRAITKMRA